MQGCACMQQQRLWHGRVWRTTEGVTPSTPLRAAPVAGRAEPALSWGLISFWDVQEGLQHAAVCAGAVQQGDERRLTQRGTCVHGRRGAQSDPATHQCRGLPHVRIELNRQSTTDMHAWVCSKCAPPWPDPSSSSPPYCPSWRSSDMPAACDDHMPSLSCPDLAIIEAHGHKHAPGSHRHLPQAHNRL